MFTGLIEDVGTIVQLSPIPDGLSIGIDSKIITEELKLGDSVAVNGVCLTVTKYQSTQFTLEAVQETLQKSTLQNLKTGSRINLERAIRFGDRMGGHFVQGHVDGKGVIQQIKPIGSAIWFQIKVSDEFDRYIINKGSIAIDGISLTVAEKSGSSVKISVIPHTFQNTNLVFLKEGDFLNIELDMMAKYIENIMTSRKNEKESKITESWLKEQGFA